MCRHPSAERALANPKVRGPLADRHQDVSALWQPLAADLSSAEPRQIVQQTRHGLKQLLNALASSFSLAAPSLRALVRNLIHGCCSDRSASTLTPSCLAISAVRSTDGNARPLSQAQTAERPTPTARARCEAGMRPIARARLVANSCLMFNTVHDE